MESLVSLLIGVRRVFEVFREETGREIEELVLGEEAFADLCLDCGVAAREIPDYVEIDGIVVRSA